jgi:MFS family permease
VNREPSLKPQVVILGLVSLLNDSSSEMIYPLLPVFLATTLGATPLVIGMIEGLADGLASVLKLVAGAWSDRLARRKPLIGSGYALAAVSRILIASAHVWPSVLAARLIDRTGKGMRSAPRDAMIADVTPPESRGRAFGFHRALDHTGAIVGPLLALLLLNIVHIPLRQMFLIAVLPGMLGVLLIVFFLRETPHEPSAVSRAAPAALGPPATLPRRFWLAIGAIALFSVANSSDVFLILKAHDAGVTTGMLPLLWAAHHVIKSLFSMRAGALSDRVGRRWLLVTGWSSYAVIYFVFPYARSMPVFFALFVAYAIPFTLSEGAERAWIAGFIPPSLRGKSFGYYYLANGVFVLAGTALFGWIWEAVSPRAAFTTGAALALGAALWVLLLGEERAARGGENAAAGA